jgi:hypothetical protein
MLSDEDKKFLGFCLACYIEDYEKEIKREERKQNKTLTGARASLARVIKLTYTEFIPESWHGAKPWE